MVSGPPLESPRFPDFGARLTRRERSLAPPVQTLSLLEKTPPDKSTPVARRGRKATDQVTGPDSRAAEGGRSTPRETVGVFRTRRIPMSSRCVLTLAVVTLLAFLLAPAPAGAGPDPTLLPVATTTQLHLTSSYNALNVTGRAAGSTYLDPTTGAKRSEEHTSELQSRFDLVCRLLL